MRRRREISNIDGAFEFEIWGHRGVRDEDGFGAFVFEKGVSFYVVMSRSCEVG